MKTGRAIIIQCRLSSTRLPQKALKPLGNKTLLEWAMNSMKMVKADYYYVATDYDSYETLLPICKKNGFECYAGDLKDVLKRFVELLSTIKTKTVIRATADNPFLFYEAAQESVKLFEEKNKGKAHCDYLTFTGLPHGSGVEVFLSESLKKAAAETADPYDHEHVGPALYNHKEKYICEFVPSPRRYNHPEFRTTVDTYSDYLRAVSIVNAIDGKENEPFSTEQILQACSSPKVKIPVVLVPSVTKGHGTGHLRRCLSAAMEKAFFVYIPEDKTLEETDKILNEYYERGLKKTQIISTIPDETYLPVVITDTFELTKQQLKELNNNRSLISIDEGSSFTEYCDYLLDIIPSCKKVRFVNKTDSSLIEKPKNTKTDLGLDSENLPGIERPQSIRFENVLVCLGGEDPGGLTIPIIKIVSKILSRAKITAVCSSKADFSALEDINTKNVQFVPPVSNLRENLFNYDLVLTHYGLTAFEAVYAGCAVILLPTSRLHVNLARKYNFAFMSDKNFSDIGLQKALNSPFLFAKLPVSEECNSLGDFLKELSLGTKMLCPVCGKVQAYPDKVIARNATRTYRRCQDCSMIYMAYTLEKEKLYQKTYFFEDYKKQYGKTYEEDFESIKAQGLRRMKIISSLSDKRAGKHFTSKHSKKTENLFDIGCAYGPFLAAAEECGFNPFGTDISEEAVAYVQKKLKISAVCSAFPDIDTSQEFGLEEFDAVTMWYVIEHFKDLGSVLRKVSSLVRKGGIFAFSTPSAEGISAVSDKEHFYQISPTDHYTVWEPGRAASILKKFSFKVEKIVSTGHHPERFPSIKKCGAQKGSAKWKMIEALSRAKKLGDTVEIYCRKM